MDEEGGMRLELDMPVEARYIFLLTSNHGTPQLSSTALSVGPATSVHVLVDTNRSTW